MRCDECKHWENKHPKYEYRDEIELGLGNCAKAKPFWDCSDWDKHGKRFMKDLKIFAQDGSGYKAEVWTRPDFFCFHFEVK